MNTSRPATRLALFVIVHSLFLWRPIDSVRPSILLVWTSIALWSVRRGSLRLRTSDPQVGFDDAVHLEPLRSFRSAGPSALRRARSRRARAAPFAGAPACPRDQRDQREYR